MIEFDSRISSIESFRIISCLIDVIDSDNHKAIDRWLLNLPKRLWELKMNNLRHTGVTIG